MVRYCYCAGSQHVHIAAAVVALHSQQDSSGLLLRTTSKGYTQQLAVSTADHHSCEEHMRCCRQVACKGRPASKVALGASMLSAAAAAGGCGEALQGVWQGLGHEGGCTTAVCLRIVSPGCCCCVLRSMHCGPGPLRSTRRMSWCVRCGLCAAAAGRCCCCWPTHCEPESTGALRRAVWTRFAPALLLV